MVQIVKIINLPVNRWQTKLYQMHQCAMIFNQEWWDIKVCMRNSQIFKAEKAFQLKMPFLSDMSIWQEIAFRPEMAMSQNWTNELHVDQKVF